MKQPKIKWLAKPEKHDYPAALSYLNLVFGKGTAKKFTLRLKDAEVTSFKAKDIFRASRLSLLGVSNLHVKRDRQKIIAGKFISPLLLVRDAEQRIVIIADGYHRLCAAYS